MEVLNLYYSATGNTQKVAERIHEAAEALGHRVNTVRVKEKVTDVDILDYDFVFVGSGVYGQFPGKALMDLYREFFRMYRERGEIKPAAPKRDARGAVVYCTYGGGHTGVNEAVPTVKYMGQLLDHLGYSIVAEWYLAGEYKTARLRMLSVEGRLGDIRGRPNESDLGDVAQRVKGVFRMWP
jgi:menaquinone-dependent protoporphyrinogen IX oxidase